MKIAICIHGLSDGKDAHGLPHNYAKEQAMNFKKHLAPYQVDYFIHTWNESARSDIETHYAPKKLEIEPINQETKEKVIFPHDLLNEKETNVRNDTSKQELNRQFLDHNNHKLYRIYCKYSRFYSLYRSDQLRQEYEQENKFTYDLVIQTRFIFGITYLKINLSNPNHLNPNLIYSVPSNTVNPNYFTLKKPTDWMIVGNSKNMGLMARTWFYMDQVYNQNDPPMVSSHKLLTITILNQKLENIFTFCKQSDWISHLIPPPIKATKK